MHACIYLSLSNMLFQIFHLKALSWIIWMNCLKPVTQSRFILTIKRFSAHTEENSRDCVSMSQATSSGCFCSDSFNPDFCKITYFTFSSLFAEKSSIFECPTAKSSTSPTGRDIMLSPVNQDHLEALKNKCASFGDYPDSSWNKTIYMSPHPLKTYQLYPCKH